METVGNHPNVVGFCGACSIPPHMCLVTPYMRNGSVYDVLVSRREPVELPLILQMAGDAAAGVLHLHSEGVIHRDLAARNLLVDDNYRVKVSDFGMSRIKMAGVGRTETSFGPVKWMAPEALRSREYSTASDSWSFGIVLWEMMARAEPHSELSNVDVAIRVVRDRLLPTPGDDWPELLVSTMQRCWQMEPAARPSMAELVEVLAVLREAAAAKVRAVDGAG
eukprot:PLAT8402.1.p2 GENE.PLAT8402.1~~PLAT8402.1.p2  ORF type:complete len:236 (-),score=120.67 PLAT8402.1:76-741(-)